jgi:hypothetical protein
MATSGDILLATREDFYMATDTAGVGDDPDDDLLPTQK